MGEGELHLSVSEMAYSGFINFLLASNFMNLMKIGFKVVQVSGSMILSKQNVFTVVITLQ